MKYYAITLLLVAISLANSAVILKFKQNKYDFGEIKIKVEKNDPQIFQIKDKGFYDMYEEFVFNRDGLIQSLEAQRCLA
jgi:hypothetical protein